MILFFMSAIVSFIIAVAILLLGLKLIISTIEAISVWYEGLPKIAKDILDGVGTLLLFTTTWAATALLVYLIKH